MQPHESFIDKIHTGNKSFSIGQKIGSCPELIDCIRQVGFLPLLESGIPGFAAEAIMVNLVINNA